MSEVKKTFKIRCIYRFKFLSRFGIQAITLYPFILFAASPADVTAELLRHELEHIYQVQRRGWTAFYFEYLRCYFSLRSKGLNHHSAYWAIPFEIEARQNEKNALMPHELAILGRTAKSDPIA